MLRRVVMADTGKKNIKTNIKHCRLKLFSFELSELQSVRISLKIKLIMYKIKIYHKGRTVLVFLLGSFFFILEIKLF